MKLSDQTQTKIILTILTFAVIAGFIGIEYLIELLLTPKN